MRTRRARATRQSGGIRFGVGPLAHLLKNRFYIGEVTYRGEVHQGEHEAILSRDLFEAVQEKLAANGIMSRRRSCRIARRKPATSLGCLPPRSKASCVIACAGILDQGPK